MLRDKLRVFVSRISPPLHVTDSYAYGPWKQANSFSFSDQWTLSIDKHLGICWMLLNHPDIVKKPTIFLLFFCYSASPFDGLQSLIFWKYFDELKLCGKILSAFRCTCSQNQTPLEHSIFSEYCENTMSLLYLSVNTSRQIYYEAPGQCIYRLNIWTISLVSWTHCKRGVILHR